MKKKIMALIVLLLLVIPCFKVYALEDSFYEGEYIPGEYIKEFSNGSDKYEQFRFFRRKSDNQAVYCIQLCETISSNKVITGYDYEQYTYANLDYSVWERIMLIAYYGYGYQNHTDSKWYAITQYMIWKETSPDTNICFTDTLNGNKVEKYQQEMDEINSLIQNHSNVPSFYNQTYQVNYKEPMTIYDTNHVLERFQIIGNGGLEISKNIDNLTFTKTRVGESQILFSNMSTQYSSLPIVYIDNAGQNLLAPGNYYPIYMILNVNLLSGNIIVNMLDQDTQSNITQGDAKLSGTKIQLLDKDNQLISEKIVQEEGSIIFENIGYGTYHIREIKSGNGYLLNSEIITIQVDSDTEITNLYSQVIKNEIILDTYLKNPITGEINIEPGIVFSIYNSQGEVVNSITTDENGQAKTILPYGTYTVRQELGVKNHYYADDFLIEVLENGKVQTFELYNEELTAKMKVINIDDDSKLPILEEGALFKIKDLKNSQYLKDTNGDILLLSTNHLGNTDFITLSSGKYQLEQIKGVDGYEINNCVSYFEISDDMVFNIDDNQDKYLEIEISNIKQKSQIEINKYTEYYWNDRLIKTEKEKDISIPIYAKVDIYSKDGVKLYMQDEEVGSAILQGESIITPLLVFGNYYIKDGSDETIIDIVLDNIGIKEIQLLNKVYEYEEILPNEEENINSSDFIEITEVPNEESDTNGSDCFEVTKILVPNTFLKKSIFYHFDFLFIGFGLFMIRKETYE